MEKPIQPQYQQQQQQQQPQIQQQQLLPPPIQQQQQQQNQQQQQHQLPSQPIQQAHVLFELSPFDIREEIDDKTQRFYQSLKQMIANKTAKECQDIYLKHIAIDSQHNTEELTIGLLVAILLEQDNQQSKYYRDIVAISRDGLTFFSNYLNIIIIERLSNLRQHSIKQIFWITQQLIQANIPAAENICSSLIRQTAGGDISPRNLYLIENLLDLFSENKNWLNSTNFMIPTVIYTFMRLIADHMNPAQANLRQKEVDFVIALIREKFLDCMTVGRDFLRVLHYIIKVPEFEKLWHDIFNNPKSLHATFQSPVHLLSSRTPRRLFQSRLTYEMERKISFLATQVKFGSQKRYQDWFHKQYLATPESLSLRCDLIRYICTIIHPSNEVLCSEIIPRWAIIGWLLTTCTTMTAASNSKLALFFDWLVYDAKMDNIMNIEPAILVMYYSMRSHPTVTSSLLDFLCRIPSCFSPKLHDLIKNGIKKSLQQVLEKRVVPTLAPLLDSPKHDAALKNLLRDTFPEFCGTVHIDNGISNSNLSNPAQVNHSTTTATTNSQTGTATTRQVDVIVIDQDKASLSTDAPTQINETVSNKTPSNQDSNHIANKQGGDQGNVNNDGRIEQSGSSSSPSSSSIASSPRDEAKAFSWNGTENANASYSHQKSHDNKIRKSSTNNSATPDLTKKQSKSVTSDESVGVQPSNNISKNTDVACNTSPLRDDGDITDLFKSNNTNQKIIYPFLTVQTIDLKESLNSFDEPTRRILEDLSIERANDARCTLMKELISTVIENSEPASNSNLFKELGHCVAYLVADDFTTRIFPSSSQDTELLKESIHLPFFVLCRTAFQSNQSNPSWASKATSLIASIAKFLEATGFLVLYFLRVYNIVKNLHPNLMTVISLLNGIGISSHYIEFCTTAKRKLNKCLYEDLSLASTYDSEMFCFLLPTVFVELNLTGSFPIMGNIDLIRLVVSTIDPINLQELICICLTGTAKVINKEDVLPLIESSLTWESWEQYCVWKLISAQNVPVENYISILPKLDTRANAEALSCILLNLQKLAEPSANIIQQVIECECKPNNLLISSILRYWSVKSDIKELARIIASLCDSRPHSPQVKRKGQAKAAVAKNPTLGSRSEKILSHLDSIRRRAPKNKLLVQAEILEMIAELETICTDDQKDRFFDLFANRPKANKKQR